MKKKKKIILVSLAAVIFLIFGFMVRNNSAGILFDRFILDIIHRNHSPIVFTIMKIISFIGSAYFLVQIGRASCRERV